MGDILKRNTAQVIYTQRLNGDSFGPKVLLCLLIFISALRIAYFISFLLKFYILYIYLYKIYTTIYI